MRARTLMVMALVAALVGGASAASAATPKFYDCTKVAPAAQLAALTDNFGGSYTLKDAQKTPATGQSHCDYVRSDVFPNGHRGTAMVWIISGPTAAGRYAGNMATARINFGKACTAIEASGQPRPDDPRRCGPVPVAGLGTKAYAAGLYVAVLRGSTFLLVSVDGTERVDAGSPNVVSTLPSQDQLATWAGRILARMK